MSNKPLGEKIGDAASSVKEDIKGGARRMEGAITGDEGKRSEHDKSSIEKCGDAIKSGAQAVGDKCHEGAVKIGLTK